MNVQIKKLQEAQQESEERRVLLEMAAPLFDSREAGRAYPLDSM